MITNSGRLWVTLNGYRLFDGEDFLVSGQTLVLATGTIGSSDVLAVTEFTESIVPEAMAFRIFQDMRGVQATYRITDSTSTFLTATLSATSDVIQSKKAPLSFLIMFGIVLMSALGVLPIAISATCGVLLMLLTNCINWKDASNALNTQVILIVVASLALGQALLQTGAASYLANVFVSFMEGSSTTFMISGLMLLMAIMTNVVSNNAAAVIGTPIAIGIAQQLSLPAEPFVLAVLFGANMSYATPMAYKTNLLVMTAGGYTFNDFLKVGIPLTLIMWLTFSWLLPLLYNL